LIFTHQNNSGTWVTQRATLQVENRKAFSQPLARIAGEGAERSEVGEVSVIK